MWLTFNMLTISRSMKSSICKIFHRIINVWNFTFLLMAPCTLYVMRWGQQIFLNNFLNLQRSVSTARRRLIYTNNISPCPTARENVWILITTWLRSKAIPGRYWKTWRWCWGMNKIHQTASGERWRFASAWFPLGCSLIFTLITRRYRCWCILP